MRLVLKGGKYVVVEDSMGSMGTVSQRQMGYSKTYKRSADDYYTTPPVAVQKLLSVEKFEGQGWEPACGNGAISKFFSGIMSSDIRKDNIYGETGIDFLSEKRQVDFIVTNPPYFLALEFAVHSLECAPKVALLLKLQFLEGVARGNFFRESPPKRIHIFTKGISCLRPDGTEAGHLMTYAWFVWERGYKGKPEVDWI